MVRDGVETHDHRFGGVCDFDKFDPAHPWRTRCGYRIPDETWRQSMKHIGKPRRAHQIENMLERQHRRQWKTAIDKQDPDNFNVSKRLDSAYFID